MSVASTVFISRSPSVNLGPRITPYDRNCRPVGRDGSAPISRTRVRESGGWECALAPSLRICFSPADCCWAVVLLGELKGQTDLSELKLRPPIGNQIG